MPKSKIFQREYANLTLLSRKQLKNVLFNKYFNLYMNNYEFSGDLDYQQKEYILLQMWSLGQVACFKLANSEGAKDHPQGLGVFCPFAPGYWNIYNWPTKVSLVNTRGVRFIPAGLKEVDKEVVIGYAMRNRKPVALFVESYVERIVDCLMVIRTNLRTHKMPWLIVGNPEDQAKLKTLFESLKQDEPELYMDTDDSNNIKALVSGAPYIIDKLYQYCECLENELREFLGFGNVGVGEKKEHLINAEVSANNAVIEANSNCLVDTIKEFFERCNNVFGFNYGIEIKKVETPEFEESNQEEEIEDE